MNLASRAQRVSHLPRRADAETPPLRVSQTVNHNSPHAAAFLSRVSAVLMALLYERSLTRYLRYFNIASAYVASLVSVYGQPRVGRHHRSHLLNIPSLRHTCMHALVSSAPVTGKQASIS